MSWGDALGGLLYDALMWTPERTALRGWRAELLAPLEGRILEIGAGTGANLAHYPPGADLTLVEPAAGMRARLSTRTDAPVTRGFAEALPFEDGRFDVAVVTLVLCSVRDVDAAALELRRVLRPGGRLFFMEHVVSERPDRARWQRRLDPSWSKLAGGCRLTRDPRASLERAGFALREIRRAEMPGAPGPLKEVLRGVGVAGAVEPSPAP